MASRLLRALLLAALAGLVATGAASCRGQPPPPFVISLPDQIETLDPHGRDLGGQLALAAHFYEPLVAKDADMVLQPRLAVRWTNPDPQTWLFTLRDGVRFHDGRPFGPEDVVHTFTRLRQDSRLEVGVYAMGVDSVRVAGPMTVELHTTRPEAVLLNKISAVPIVPRGSGAELGALPCGTGPYRFVSWPHRSTVEMVRADGYWGAAPALPRVTLRLGRSADAATFDVLSGHSQLARCASRAAEAAVARAPALRVVRRTGVSLKYLGFDTGREDSPYVAVQPNPFRDVRVRQAVTLALDRAALVGALPASAEIASQLVPSAIFGFDPGIPAPHRDLDAARRLLAQAGHAGGFAVTLHARRLAGVPAEPLRRMLADLGILATVQELDEPAFFQLVRDGPSLYLTRYACDTGDLSDVLEAGMHSVDAARRFGTANAGRWSDPELDAAIEHSAAVMDPMLRRRELQRVMRAAIERVVWVPLYFDEDVYAIARPWVWRPRADGYVLAAEIH